MTTTVATIAEGMTTGQAGKMTDQLITYCRKNGSTLPKDIVQEVLKQEGGLLVKEQFEALRKRVETHSERARNSIVRMADVNYDVYPAEMIKATNRKEYLIDSVVTTIPRRQIGLVKGVEVHFFKVGRYLTTEEVDKELELRGLISDSYAQAQVNADDPSFADEHPNGTQWNRYGKVSSCLSFRGWGSERDVSCGRDGHDWDNDWWFSGVRKVSE